MSQARAPLLDTAQAPSCAWYVPLGIIIVVIIVSIMLKSQNWGTLFEGVCLSVAVGNSEAGTSRRPRQGGWGGTGGRVTVGRMSATHDGSLRVSCHIHCTGESIHVCMCAFVVWMGLGEAVMLTEYTAPVQ